MDRFGRGVLEAAELQLAAYPASTLRDIYKSFFQDEYGPGHLLGDPEKARAYFDRELRTMSSRGRRRAEPCGLGLRFKRIPMDLVADGLADADAYFAAFLRGAGDFALPDADAWMRKWKTIALALEALQDRIPSFEADRTFLAEALGRGEWVQHHSPEYETAYDPHYRIFSVRTNLD